MALGWSGGCQRRSPARSGPPPGRAGVPALSLCHPHTEGSPPRVALLSQLGSPCQSPSHGGRTWAVPTPQGDPDPTGSPHRSLGWGGVPPSAAQPDLGPPPPSVSSGRAGSPSPLGSPISHPPAVGSPPLLSQAQCGVPPSISQPIWGPPVAHPSAGLAPAPCLPLLRPHHPRDTQGLCPSARPREMWMLILSLK